MVTIRHLLLLTYITALSARLFCAGYTLPMPVDHESNLWLINDMKPSSTVILFSHGMGGSYKNSSFIMKTLEIDLPCFSFNYPDVAGGIKETSFAQDNEIATLKEAFTRTCAHLNPEQKIILFGWSRGASTIVTTLPQLTPQETNRIAAIVLQSPFDTIEAIAYFKCKWHWLVRFVHCKLVPAFFGKYDPTGITPLAAVETLQQYHKTIPIFFVYAMKDSLVPWHSSARLFIALQKNGHEHMCLVELLQGDHNTLFNNRESRYRYRDSLHAFLSLYTHPMNQAYVTHGNQFLAFSPSLSIHV